MKVIILLACAGFAVSAEAQKPRMALLLGEKGPHHDEFNNVLSTLGWDADRYRCMTNDMRKLADRLGHCDMLVDAPIFWPQPPDNKVSKAFWVFVETGGLVRPLGHDYL